MSSDLSGKIAVVTGGNGGIGYETVAGLAEMGAHVVIAARNAEKARTAVDELRARTGADDRISTLPIDLASFASVREFAAAFTGEHDRCDILVNNAGLMVRKRSVTVDGHETQFQTNHLGHFLLTNLLRDALARTGSARVVNLASGAHRMARKGLDFDDLDSERGRYRGFTVYGQTKLMNILFTRELARRWADIGVTANAVHPGWVGTNFAANREYGRIGDAFISLGRRIARTPAQGAETSIYLASSPDVDGITGQYFSNCKAELPARPALDDAAAERLWDVSEKLTGV